MPESQKMKMAEEYLLPWRYSRLNDLLDRDHSS